MKLFNRNKPTELEFRALPLNVPQFTEWSSRIIEAACLPTKNLETQKFALAGMILQTAPHDFMRPDEYYINLLRKAAADQLAMQVIEDLKLQREQRLKNSEATQNQGVVNVEKPTAS